MSDSGEGLDLEFWREAPVPATRQRRLPMALALVLAVILVLILTAIVGYRWFVMPTTDQGTCFVFDPDQCSALSAARIEGSADLRIPEGASIVESGSSKTLKSGSETALIRLGEPRGLSLGGGYVEQIDAVVGALIADRLSQRDIDQIDSVFVDLARSSTVVFANAGDGTAWAYVYVVWDG